MVRVSEPLWCRIQGADPGGSPRDGRPLPLTHHLSFITTPSSQVTRPQPNRAHMGRIMSACVCECVSA